MRLKRISFFLLALVFLTSMAVAGCGGGGGAQFAVSNLVINPTSAQAGDKVEISLTITNSGGASGMYNTRLSVNGVASGNQTVEVLAGSSTTVTFDYTPSVSGTLPISVESSAGTLSGTLTVTASEGYWEIPYKCVEGTYVLLNYSLSSAPQVSHLMSFNESSGVVLSLRVNKSVVDGARDVLIPATTWVMPEFVVKGITQGVDMDLLVGMTRDGTGKLYVQNGVGDVDIISESTSGQSPIQDNTQGDGTKDPAGSMVVELPLIGYFDTTVGEEGDFPFSFLATTGHTSNTVHIKNNKKMDGATMAVDGVPFAKSGGLADYVGTPGTLSLTGTDECLGIRIVGMRIDLQVIINLVMEPAD